MACRACGAAKAAKNLLTVGAKQPNKIRWIKDGASGLIRSLGGALEYSPEDVQLNRDVCRQCEFATKDDNGVLNTLSQCMAPDEANNGVPCGCFILPKTEVGDCPQKKWTTLKISAQPKV